MNRFWKTLVAVFGLWGCSTVDIDDYRAEKPVLELRDYFNGTLDAWGMFQDRSGKVVKRFHVVIEASWQGEVGTLDERFAYSDGSTQRRVWTITRLGPGRYSGRADGVVGGASGEAPGAGRPRRRIGPQPRQMAHPPAFFPKTHWPSRRWTNRAACRRSSPRWQPSMALTSRKSQAPGLAAASPKRTC